MQPAKTNCLKNLLLSILTIAFVQVSAQMNYLEYRKEQKQIIFNEPFDSNEKGWPSTSKINSGMLVVDEDQDQTFKRNTKNVIKIPADITRDFEIEVSMLFDKNSMTGAYGISWDNYLWQFIGTNFNIDFYSTRWKFVVNSVGVDNIIKKAPNKYTIRKIGGNYYFFVNEKYFAYTAAKPIDGLNIGFYGKTLSVDHIKVSYLLKEDEASSLNTNTFPDRSPAKADGLIPIRQEIKQGGKYYALIVGVSKYDEPKLNLDKPEKDAEKIKEIFIKRYSFTDSTTFLLQNPTRQKIIAELYRLRKIIGPNDNLLIFYAGHGFWDEDARQGYWWAKDAVPDDPSTWLSNSDLREQIRSIKSAHTLLISDACFSGGIFKTRSGNDIQNASRDIQMLYQMPSRRAITSGTMTAVPDNSIFLEYLSKRLTENKNKFLSSQQLFDSFRAAVINNSSAVPQDGVIAETGDEGGDFIFILKEN